MHFSDLLPLPSETTARVDEPICPAPVQTPRVVVGSDLSLAPRVVTAVIDKPLRVINKPASALKPMMTRRARLMRRVSLDNQARITRSQMRTHSSEFTQAMAIMERNTVSESLHAIFDEASGKVLKYRQLLNHPDYKEVWSKSSANEFGRLAQGVGTRIKGTDTIFFISKHDVPSDRRKDITYGKFVCEYKPNKAEKERTRFTVGGDKINYPGDCGTPTGDLTLVKIHLNSVISTKNAQYMTVDIKNFLPQYADGSIQICAAKAYRHTR